MGPSRRTVSIVILTIILMIAVGAAVFFYLSGKPSGSPITPPAANEPTIAPHKVASGFTAPTAIVASPESSDNRLYVVERAGTIRSIVPITGETPKPFLDITNKVFAGNEMGLLGLAFHPDYDQNGFIFINYINKQKNTVLARYHVTDAGTVDTASEKVILSFHQPHDNHNGGDLAFGPDNYLYVALGDGGGAGDPENRAQNKDSLFGKILRLDINTDASYTIPPSNPFVGEQGTRPEIWAYGLRNPWRISFDKLTGDLYIADVGQGNMEEINFQPANSTGGENYGWRCYEGTRPYNADGCADPGEYTKPVIEYDHADERCSVTGGYVYRGEAWPQLEGKYFYGDFCNGQLFYTIHKDGTWTQTEAIRGSYSISAFGQSYDGDIYFADFNKGDLYKIETSDVQ